MLRPIPFACICILLLYVNASSAQCPAPVALSISNITTTESRCQSTGTATIQVTGGAAPYFYSIIAGPVTTPLQSSNTFQSLAAGDYTVQVTDFCNVSVTGNFTVTGSYSVPQVWEILQEPRCQGTNDGRIFVNVHEGRGPFTYALISPSPVIVPPQPDNVFTALPPGAYTYQVTDSCGNFQTRTVTLRNSDNGAFTVALDDFHYEDCDSFSIPYSINRQTAFKPPYTARLTLPDGTTKTHILPESYFRSAVTTAYDTFHFKYPHRRGNQDNVIITVVNDCGISQYAAKTMVVLDMVPVALPPTDCSGVYNYTFDLNKDNNPTAPSPRNYNCNNITYTLVNPAGVIVATQTNNSTFSGYPAGTGYKVIREDCCKRDTLQFYWAPLPKVRFTGYYSAPYMSYKEGTTTVNFGVQPLATGSIVVASGPATATFKDGTVHTFSYPDTITNQPFGTTGVNIKYFVPGAYKVYAVDGCGQKDSLTFTLTASQMRRDMLTARMVKGCLGNNKIIWNATTNKGSGTISGMVGISPGDTYPWQYSYNASQTDSFVNVLPGAYSLKYVYQHYNTIVSYRRGMNVYPPDTLSHTLSNTLNFTIPPYTQPAFAAAPAIAVCANNRHIALLPDSTAGVTPFQYQITAGPTTTVMQSSPVFQNLQRGTYTMLMADACGNSYSRSFSIDTLLLPNIATIGSTCEGGAATFTLPNWPFYTYMWEKPDGSLSAGNTLHINPVTQADTGLYNITVFSSVGGCSDQTVKQSRLNFCSTFALPLTLLHFSGKQNGNNIVLTWKTADEINISHFILQRSADGIHFNNVQQVNASGLLVNNYTATDNRPLPGISYYRLQIVNTHGKTEYSKIISFDNKTTGQPNVFPRLISNESTIMVTYDAVSQPAFIQVARMDGRVILTQPVAKNSVQTTIDVSKLVKGNYLVIYVHNNIRNAVQIVKL
jgi:hypothetical protein